MKGYEYIEQETSKGKDIWKKRQVKERIYRTRDWYRKGYIHRTLDTDKGKDI